jgi:signal transduction histidine kinase
MRRRLASSVGWQALVIAGCTGIAILSSIAYYGLTTRHEFFAVQVAAYPLGYLVAGSVAWIQRRHNPVGPVMLATSVAGSLSFFAFHPDPLVWRPAGISGSLANVLIVWLLLAAPSGRLGPGIGRWALAAFLVIVLSAAVISDLAVLRVMFAIGVLVSLVLAVVVLRRWLTASPASRRALTPVAAAGVAISLVHAGDFASGVFLIPITPGGVIYWADTISRILVPFGFLIGLLRLRMARGAVAELVVELAEAMAPERLRDALATALHDPTLTIVYWSPAFRTFLDADGAPIEPEADGGGRAVTYLEQAGQPMAAILHDPALSEDPGLVAAVGAAARLAVSNERLASEIRAQLEEVRASRSRIVEASDAERRRVERNLHDGAQQRLVALSLALRRAQAQLPAEGAPESAATLKAASEQLAAALAELRELAKGIHPAVLSEAGLEPALRSLARESPVKVVLRVELPDAVSDAASVAAYFVAAEALTNVAKYAAATRVDLAVQSDGRELRIEISDDGIGGAKPAAGSGLRGLADRVAALGGRLDIRSPAGEGTRVVARLPLTAAAELPS